MKFNIPEKYIRYSLMAILYYLIFDKYNIKYNLENCLLASLSFIIINKLLKKAEGFEDSELEEQLKEESPGQENSPEIVEEIIEEIVQGEEPPQKEESKQEEPQQEEESKQEEEPQQEEPQQEEPQQEEPQQEEESKQEEIKPYSSEELQKLQKKYTIMPVESWIKNEISVMQDLQKTESCSCPTLSRGSNDYLEF